MGRGLYDATAKQVEELLSVVDNLQGPDLDVTLGWIKRSDNGDHPARPMIFIPWMVGRAKRPR